MEFLLDTIDLNQIKEAVEYLPITGVTCNPSIVKKTNPKDFFEHCRSIRKIITTSRSLHIQVTEQDYEGMIEEAKTIVEKIDKHVYIKIPVTYEGIRALKTLKQQGYNTTATAVYDLMQAYLALACNVDYIAPYVNRIGNLGGNPQELINELSNKIISDNYQTKIVGASYKNLQQIKESFNNGANAITTTLDLLKTIFDNPSIDKAVKDFNDDWYSIYDSSLNEL